MSQVNDVRPPYVEFQMRAVEDRSESLKQGRYMTKDVPFIILVPHGSEGKQRIEQEYEVWLQKIKPMTGPKGGSYDGHYEVASRFNPDWVQKIETQFRLWKKGEQFEVEGTHLRNWPAISPAQLKNCLDMHLLTVEQLANAADDTVERLGMGGYTLRQRARDWLAAQGGGSAKTAIEMENLRAEVASRDVTISSMKEQLEALQRQINALQVSQA